MKIRNGDLIEVKTETNDTWFAEVVDHIDKIYIVFYITEHNDGYYRYDTDVNEVIKENIVTHVRNRYNYEEAWQKMGFQMRPDENETMKFEKIVTQNKNRPESPVSSLDTDSTCTSASESIDSVDSWSSHSSEESLDFIVHEYSA